MESIQEITFVPSPQVTSEHKYQKGAFGVEKKGIQGTVRSQIRISDPKRAICVFNHVGTKP